ncbi:MAG: lytic murein transglycosylase [Pseudolabrys sp.]|nr:lytic murein transglycosylase [Pseudolabrys sp.]
MSKVNVTIAAALAGAVLFVAAPAFAAQCNHKGGFNSFIADFKKEAASKGISKKGLAALDGLSVDDKVLAADRRQHVFKQSFEQFSGRMISRDRLTKGAKMLQQHAATLKRIEQQYGVPGPVVIAIWGLETDYGINQGKMSVVRSVATLAYDCRRTDKFQAELADALRIIDRGDMASADMKGDWAGEIGQTQFLPSSYVKYAVDFDRKGRRDLVRSVPDVLASTANYLKGHGWQRGQGWGPGKPNFSVIQEWNKAEVYAKTIALFADKLDGGRSVKGAEKELENKKTGQKDKRAQR